MFYSIFRKDSAVISINILQGDLLQKPVRYFTNLYINVRRGKVKIR